jgi:hypothetical protein
MNESIIISEDVKAFITASVYRKSVGGEEMNKYNEMMKCKAKA